MYDVDAIEAINFEQLATVTDRLLLRRGRVSKRRPSTSRIGPVYVPEPIEKTIVMRVPRNQHHAAKLAALGSVLFAIALFVATLA
jgi:hypothetical protein